jgi:5-methylcytosine-specific restriction protein B
MPVVFDNQVIEDLKKQVRVYRDKGEFVSTDDLERYLDLFRERFGPDRLSGLDGDELLRAMHGRDDTHSSLMYWLEFKDDDEFATQKFGGIAGGSALKFGIYQRARDAAWIIGSSLSQHQISLREAIEVARVQRDQLISGCELLSALPKDAGDEEYGRLQEALENLRTDSAETISSAWAHKYFYLLNPEKLDDFHTIAFERFNLIKMLQIPPEGDGQYRCAGRFVALMRLLDIPMQHLTHALNLRNGKPYKYWRLGTRPGEGTSRSEKMIEESCAAIGWSELGDLSSIGELDRTAAREKIRSLLNQKYPKDPRVIGRQSQEILNFVFADDNDVVLASDGERIVAIGRIAGDYHFDEKSELPHQRPVSWLADGEWRMPLPNEALRTTWRELRDPQNLIETERRLLDGTKAIKPVPSSSARTIPRGGRIPLGELDSTIARIASLLDRKKQVILHGPPGTGKTYWAERAARELASRRAFGKEFESLSDSERLEVTGQPGEGGGLVQLCSFHASYSYEDFIEGLRPVIGTNGQMVFVPRDGIFVRLCERATAQPDRPFCLIIDEINRGDITRVFGELLTVLEADKRGKEVVLPLTQRTLRIPENLLVIGTMNTADRSIALLDVALRRRFGFVELMPDSSLFGDTKVGDIPLRPWFEGLNRRIREKVGRDSRNLQIGHSYFLENGHPITNFARFREVIRNEVIPLIQEYCYGDFETQKAIVGKGLYDPSESVRDSLFTREGEQELVHALLEPDESITTSEAAVAADAKAELSEEEAETADET